MPLWIPLSIIDLHVTRVSVFAAMRTEYPTLGDAIIFEMSRDRHAVIYEVPGNYINWIIYTPKSKDDVGKVNFTLDASTEEIEALNRGSLSIVEVLFVDTSLHG